jgi:hypothetical protein
LAFSSAFSIFFSFLDLIWVDLECIVCESIYCIAIIKIATFGGPIFQTIEVSAFFMAGWRGLVGVQILGLGFFERREG